MYGEVGQCTIDMLEITGYFMKKIIDDRSNCGELDPDGALPRASHPPYSRIQNGDQRGGTFS
jgi:hypothetical protein